MLREKRIKLICTIGPATGKRSIMKKMIKEGMDVARLNFSHGSYDFFKQIIKDLREASLSLKKEIGILADLQGPKIRIGEFASGEISCKKGAKIRIDTNPERGSNERISINMPHILKDIHENERILLSDGLVSLRVIEKSKDVLLCRIENEGIVRSRAGMNLPDTSLSLPSLTEKDIQDLKFIIKQEVDYIALSFVRKPEDISALRGWLQKSNCDIPVISKIEKPEAMENIIGIIDASDGIMVARGDLGVECSPELVPVYQKEIISECNKRGKFVITATQMLESMIHNPRPTRAETSDIANAIFDGTCAVMLSGETSIGKYPVEAIKMVNQVAKVSENISFQATIQRRRRDFYIFNEKNISEGIARESCLLAEDLNANLIVCLSHSGNTAQYVAKYRPKVPIVAVSDNVNTIRKMSLIWGTSAIIVEKIKHTDESLKALEIKIENLPGLKENDVIIMTAGIPTLQKGSTNMMKVHTVAKSKRNLF